MSRSPLMRTGKRWMKHGRDAEHSVTRAEELQLEQVYSRGLGPYFVTGTNHQTVVEGRAPRHRGVLMGRVAEVESDGVVIEVSEAHEIAPLKEGDGLVFDAADWRSPGEPEEGGRVYEATRPDDGNTAGFGSPIAPFASTASGQAIWSGAAAIRTLLTLRGLYLKLRCRCIGSLSRCASWRIPDRRWWRNGRWFAIAEIERYRNVARPRLRRPRIVRSPLNRCANSLAGWETRHTSLANVSLDDGRVSVRARIGAESTSPRGRREAGDACRPRRAGIPCSDPFAALAIAGHGAKPTRRQWERCPKPNCICWSARRINSTPRSNSRPPASRSITSICMA